MVNLDLTLNQIAGVRAGLLTSADTKLETFHRDIDYDDDYDFEYYDGYALEDELFDYTENESLDEEGNLG